MVKIEFYVPYSHLEKVKNAMFQAGAGKIGNYDSCAWETKGTGQFRPLKGSKPFIGNTDKIERTEEFKVEMVCMEEYLHEVINAMKSAHPYETPAYQYWFVYPLA